MARELFSGGRAFLEKKWVGVLFFSGLAFVFAVLLGKDMMFGLGLFGGLVGLGIVILCLTKVEAGFYQIGRAHV